MIAACAAILSPEDVSYGEDAGGGDSGDGSAEGASSCARCLPATPSGWVGPFALQEGPDGGAPPSCSAPFPSKLGDFFGGLTVSPEGCACACAPPTASCAVALLLNETAVCDGGGVLAIAPLGQCIPVDPGGSMEVQSAQVDAGSCQPQQSPPSVAWATRVTACTPISLAPCGTGGLCVPPVSEGVCLSHDGDEKCPPPGAPDYAVRRSYFTGSNSALACRPCTCDSPSASSCAFSLEYFDQSAACSGRSNPVIGPGCRSSPTTSSGKVTELLLEAGTCSVTSGSEGGTIGTATSVGPTTLCCTN